VETKFAEWHEGRRRHAVERIRGVMHRRGLSGAVVTKPGTVAWASGAMNPPIDRTAAEDTVWLAIGLDSVTVITTDVEHDRIRAELLPTDFGLVSVPWWDPSALVQAASRVLSTPAAELGADGHAGFGVDLEHELALVRLPLSPDEQDELRALGADAATAVENALRSWTPGDLDTSVAANIAHRLELDGAEAPVLLVGSGERVARFRHPVARGEQTTKMVMAVLVARRHGLHVALTRYVAAEPTPELDADLATVWQIHRQALATATPGRTYGDLYAGLDLAYTASEKANAWIGHYQGGPIGYGQREFELAPCQTASPWWSVRIEAGTALALNPSLPGGAKDEDTFLVTDAGLELITTTHNWPLADSASPPRPGVLRYGGAHDPSAV
jgi:Xaa-Pro dipeptidase